jgi:glycosyltransferase involved in cell wall biosynthesis
MPTTKLMMKKLPPMPLPGPRISRAIDTFQPDIVHTFGNALMSWHASYAAHRRGIPVVGFFQTHFTIYAPYYGWGFIVPMLSKATQWLHANQTITLVPSPSLQAYMDANGFRNMSVWPHGIDSQTFSPEHVNENTRRLLFNGRSEDQLLCVAVSRLAPEKTIHELLPLAQMGGVALTIVGDGPEREALEVVFDQTDTFFTGMLYGSNLSAAFASADVYVSASQTETFGLTTLEASASGLPCVVLDGNGTRDLIEDGTTGYICHSVPEMIERIRQLRDDPELRQHISKRARETALRYDWVEAFDQLETIYAEVMKQSNHH